ncbi:MAG: zinc-binding dehydrogenase, partial [Gammaproteobacteria bacterium]|nr:zinc-binding dehydrogenase [Gammaproteobacteria bacterium]
TFGDATGPVEPFAPSELAVRGSLYVTRPILYDFINSRDSLLNASKELFDFITGGDIEVRIGQTYRLEDAVQAHRDLEARKTTGSTVLLP